jgi:hypothetical protein
MNKLVRIAALLAGVFVVALAAAWGFMIVRNCCAPSSFDLTGTAIAVTNDAIVTMIAGTQLVGLEATFTAQAARIATAVASPSTVVSTDILISSTAPTRAPCYFNWATQDLPELTAEVQAAMDDAGLERVTISASAYGENCYANDTNEVQYFAAMQTDFSVTAQVEDIEDGGALGDLTVAIITVLNEYPPGEAPGLMPGQITILFVQGERETRLTLAVERIAEVLGWGYTGETLWSALVGEG